MDLTGLPYRRSEAARHPAREHACALCGYPATGWDHCHEHGFVRGPMCSGCNTTMALVDAGEPLHVWGPRTVEAVQRLRLRCPSCPEQWPTLQPQRVQIQVIKEQRRLLTDRLTAQGMPRTCSICPAVQYLHGVAWRKPYTPFIRSLCKRANAVGSMRLALADGPGPAERPDQA